MGGRRHLERLILVHFGKMSRMTKHISSSGGSLRSWAHLHFIAPPFQLPCKHMTTTFQASRSRCKEHTERAKYRASRKMDPPSCVDPQSLLASRMTLQKADKMQPGSSDIWHILIAITCLFISEHPHPFHFSSTLCQMSRYFNFFTPSPTPTPTILPKKTPCLLCHLRGSFSSNERQRSWCLWSTWSN